MDTVNLELSLSLEPFYAPRTIAGILIDVEKLDNGSEKIALLESYLRQFKEELSQIQNLKYRTPQAVFMLEDGIRTIEERISKAKGKTWEPPPREDYFGPGLGLSSHALINPVPRIRLGTDRFCDSAVAPPGSRRQRPPLQGPPASGKKIRRYWSFELHSMFLEAVEILGGPIVAKPEEILRLMRDDGLTIDQVKCHLQKYRAYKKKERLHILKASLDGSGVMV